MQDTLALVHEFPRTHKTTIEHDDGKYEKTAKTCAKIRETW